MLRTFCKKKEWLRDTTSLFASGVVTLDHLTDVIDPIDLAGMESCFNDLVDFSRFKQAGSLGINFRAEDMSYKTFLLYSTIDFKLKEIQGRSLGNK